MEEAMNEDPLLGNLLAARLNPITKNIILLVLQSHGS